MIKPNTTEDTDWYHYLYQDTDPDFGKIELVKYRSSGLALKHNGLMAWQSWCYQPPSEDAYRVLAEKTAALCAALDQMAGWIGGYPLTDHVSRSLREAQDALVALNRAREDEENDKQF